MLHLFNVDFVVRLRDVYKFSLQQRQQELSRSVPFPIFLYAEVDTAEEEIREAHERTGVDYHSLIIEADVLRAGIIFRDVSVTGTEPTATELMMRDPRFRFPFQD